MIQYCTHPYKKQSKNRDKKFEDYDNCRSDYLKYF